jgi:hypothetical protein
MTASTFRVVVVAAFLLFAFGIVKCGVRVEGAEGATPPHTSSILAERVVLRVVPGKVTAVRSQHGFTKADRIGVAVYVGGRQLKVVAERPLTFAGSGVYVEVRTPPESQIAIRAVGFRSLRVVVYLEWENSG